MQWSILNWNKLIHLKIYICEVIKILIFHALHFGNIFSEVLSTLINRFNLTSCVPINGDIAQANICLLTLPSIENFKMSSEFIPKAYYR